jgi:DNA-binding MarR family transcriptional regulator
MTRSLALDHDHPLHVAGPQPREAAGLCRRASNPHDRRSSILALTSLGEHAYAAAGPTADAAIAARLQEIAAGDLATTARVMGQLRTTLETYAG